MRRAISIILAAVLTTTPIKVVLAQTEQQGLQVTATDIPSVVPLTDQTPVRIGVPVVELNSEVALLFTAAMRDMTTANDPLPNVAPFRRGSTAGSVMRIVVVAVVVLGLAAVLFVCAARQTCD